MSGKNHKFKNARIPFAENTHAIGTLSPAAEGPTNTSAPLHIVGSLVSQMPAQKLGRPRKSSRATWRAPWLLLSAYPNQTTRGISCPQTKICKKMHDKNKMKSGSWTIHFKYVPKHCFAQLFLHVPSCSFMFHLVLDWLSHNIPDKKNTPFAAA